MQIDRATADATIIRSGHCPECGTPFAGVLQQQLLAHCKFCGVAWSIEPLIYEPSREKPNDLSS